MKYKRKELVVERDVAGENLLIPVNTCSTKVFTLNNVGSMLWGLIETPQDENELASALVERYGIGMEQALDDTRAFLADMTRLDLAIAEPA